MHSFYAVMGGFVFETSTPILGPHIRFALTRHGVEFLMENAPELVPDLSEASILNRSQSDSLGKALLIIQLLYFCISCAARWAQSLPLTLLEVSTFAHAICAVATYLVWWKKPFDIAEPTVISGAQADEAAAYLLLISMVRRDVIAGLIPLDCDSEYSYLTISQASISDTGHSSEGAIDADGTLRPLDVQPSQIVRINNFTFMVSSKEPASFSSFIYGRGSVPWCHRDRGPGGTARLEEQDLARWRLAAGAMVRFPGHHPADDAMYVTWRGGLQYSVFLWSDTTWWPCIPAIIAALYGSCHLLGWDAAFPTSVEHTMWRAGGLAMVIFGFFASVLPQITAHEYQSKALGFFILEFGVPIYFISLVVYPVIGSFLIVESVRQLLYLPDDAFQLPDFSLYLPHFT